jgi:hypothetical protein
MICHYIYIKNLDQMMKLISTDEIMRKLDDLAVMLRDISTTKSTYMNCLDLRLKVKEYLAVH